MFITDSWGHNFTIELRWNAQYFRIYPPDNGKFFDYQPFEDACNPGINGRTSTLNKRIQYFKATPFTIPANGSRCCKSTNWPQCQHGFIAYHDFLYPGHMGFLIAPPLSKNCGRSEIIN